MNKSINQSINLQWRKIKVHRSGSQFPFCSPSLHFLIFIFYFIFYSCFVFGFSKAVRCMYSHKLTKVHIHLEIFWFRLLERTQSTNQGV